MTPIDWTKPVEFLSGDSAGQRRVPARVIYTGRRCPKGFHRLLLTEISEGTEYVLAVNDAGETYQGSGQRFFNSPPPKLKIPYLVVEDMTNGRRPQVNPFITTHVERWRTYVQEHPRTHRILSEGVMEVEDK